MTHPPRSLDDQLFEGMNLDAVARELLDQARVDPAGKAARTLLKGAGLTVVVTALRNGATLAEHAAPGPVMIVPLIGRVQFDAPTQSTAAAVEGGRALAMSPGMRHAVTAHEDAAFVLVIGARPPA